MGLKNKLVDNIIAPVATSHSATFIRATVNSSNEKNNTCTVTYTNPEGVKVKQENIPVKLTNVSFIDWFPKKNEKVNVSIKRGEIFVTGPDYQNSYSSVRSSIQLAQDIHSDNSSYFMGGYIY